MGHDKSTPIPRHEFVDHSLRLGWKITSAATDHLVMEASNRWQMTAWFGMGLAGLIELYDAQTGDHVRFHLDGQVPAPHDVLDIIQSLS